MHRWYAGVGLLSMAMLSACGGGNAAPAGGQGGGEQGPVAVATSTMLGSVVSQITTCAGTSSATIMGPGDDPHEFSASSAQVAQMAKAKLVVANGLGLEQNMQKSIDNAKSDGAVVFEVAPALDPIDFEGGAEEEHAEGDHEEHGSKDPHFWQDVSRMSRGADLIGQELTKRTQDAKYTECGHKVSDDIKQVDTKVRDTLAPLPADHRTLVTDHDALGYFAKAYDFKIVGTVVPGGSTDAEPSSQDMAKLAEKVREAKVRTVFSNTAVNPKTVDALAKEAGQDVKVVPLYVDSVGAPGSGADTYQTMMTTNAQRIADGLK